MSRTLNRRARQWANFSLRRSGAAID